VSTMADMLAEMADDMERSDTDAFRKKVMAAIRQYQPRRFFFNESRAVTFNTVASTDTYSFTTIGTEFYRIDGAFVTIASGDVRELTPVDYVRWQEETADEDTTTGEPEEFAYVNRAIRLWRNPDAIYSVRLVGHVKAIAPATDEEADNVWMTEAYDLIMSRAKAELYAHRYEDPSNAAIMREAEKSALDRLTGATDDKVAPQYLTATEF
jgi:hypothetical protein